MTYDEALFKHKMWKLKVADYIRNPDHSLKPEVCLELGIELNHWLQSSDYHELKNSKEFVELMKANRSFHKVMGELVLNANRGVRICEEVAIGMDSPFNKNSETIVRILTRLKNS